MQIFLSRRFRNAVAALILLCWLPFVLPGGAAAEVIGTASSFTETSAAASTTICHCANCPGGKMCCCRRSKGTSTGDCLCGACGRKLPVAAAVVLPKVLPASAFRFAKASLKSEIVALIPMPDQFQASRVLSPLYLPPRLS